MNICEIKGCCRTANETAGLIFDNPHSHKTVTEIGKQKILVCDRVWVCDYHLAMLPKPSLLSEVTTDA